MDQGYWAFVRLLSGGGSDAGRRSARTLLTSRLEMSVGDPVMAWVSYDSLSRKE